MAKHLRQSLIFSQFDNPELHLEPDNLETDTLEDDAILTEAMAAASDDSDLDSSDFDKPAEVVTAAPVVMAPVDSVPGEIVGIPILNVNAVAQNKIDENPLKRLGDIVDRGGKEVVKPLMNSINVMRAEFCLRRPDLMKHEKCLKFLLDRCVKESSGYGYCVEFEDDLAHECSEGETLPGEATPCEMLNKLRNIMTPDGRDSLPKPQERVSPTPPPPTPPPPALPSPPPPPRESPVVQENNLKNEAINRIEPRDLETDANEREFKDEDKGTLASKMPAVMPASVATDSMAKVVQQPGLPDQGYDELSNELVIHDDLQTQTADWRAEWPTWDESEDQSTDRICQEKPSHLWCQLWLKDRATQVHLPSSFANAE